MKPYNPHVMFAMMCVAGGCIAWKADLWSAFIWTLALFFYVQNRPRDPGEYMSVVAWGALFVTLVFTHLGSGSPPGGMLWWLSVPGALVAIFTLIGAISREPL